MKTGAYFYPLTTRCKIRAARGKSIGFDPIDETNLVQTATKLFPNHIQPNIYTLGSKKITRWDDDDPKMMAIQVELAKSYGIDFFIFDTYIGKRSNKFMQEMARPLNQNFKNCPEAKTMKFGIMLCMGSPRVVFPIPRVKGYVEPNRNYDLDASSARYIVDKCILNYWNEENYLYINNKPYVSLFLPDFSSDLKLFEGAKEFIEEFISYSSAKYKVEPYLVGVLKKIEHLKTYMNAGITKFTSYQQLADFDLTAPPLQDYTIMLEKRKKEWSHVLSAGGLIVPSVVIGWDSSPRGEHNLTLEEVSMCYPYTPIIINGSPETFKRMLKETRDFILKRIPQKEQYSIICSWNEVSEGNALLPKLINGVVNFEYLNALKQTIYTESS